MNKIVPCTDVSLDRFLVDIDPSNIYVLCTDGIDAVIQLIAILRVLSQVDLGSYIGIMY